MRNLKAATLRSLNQLAITIQYDSDVTLHPSSGNNDITLVAISC